MHLNSDCVQDEMNDPNKNQVAFQMKLLSNYNVN